MKRIAMIALIAFAACGGTARAADICLTLPQARAAYPNVYLHYRLDDGRRCWDAQSATRRTARHRVSPLQTVPVPVPRQTVLWPSLASLATPVDAALLTPEPATAWPLLLDVDEITGGPVAECCWPPLEPPFTDRWFALPSNWFAAVTQ
jgi:hypothetical protein